MTMMMMMMIMIMMTTTTPTMMMNKISKKETCLIQTLTERGILILGFYVVDGCLLD
jgi:hypothetical protein